MLTIHFPELKEESLDFFFVRTNQSKTKGFSFASINDQEEIGRAHV